MWPSNVTQFKCWEFSSKWKKKKILKKPNFWKKSNDAMSLVFTLYCILLFIFIIRNTKMWYEWQCNCFFAFFLQHCHFIFYLWIWLLFCYLPSIRFLLINLAIPLISFVSSFSTNKFGNLFVIFRQFVFYL